jgi:hypothetical protein
MRKIVCALTIIPADSETKSRINVTSAVLRNSTRERKPSRQFTETLHHAKDCNTGERITKEDGDRTSIGKCSSNTEEETSTNGTTECDKLDVSRFETVTS